METTIANAARSPLPSLLETALKEGLVYSADGTKTKLHSNVSLEEALQLYKAVTSLKARRTAEVGFAQGISCLAILQGLSDNGGGEHHVMDPFQAKFGDVGIEMVRRSGLNHLLTFYRKFPEEVIPSLPTLDFVFIDASHLFDLTLFEFVLADKKLRVGGYIGFHDLWMPSLQKMLRYILSNRSYRVVNAAPSSGLSFKHRFLQSLPGAARLLKPEMIEPWSAYGMGNMVLIEKTADDSREWTHHVNF
ncbi:MAG: class I SAM-dependent methyltransferase [Verrucomicrobiota bacterium]|nr:class I SAM-dependent methyltransferase [Verrucomicrobiota bacterium]